jgi:hypothetical protein
MLGGGLGAGKILTGNPMIEQEWRGSTDPRPMLEFLNEKATDRKLWLFAYACWWHATDDLTAKGRHLRQSIQTIGRFAEGSVSCQDLGAALNQLEPDLCPPDCPRNLLPEIGHVAWLARVKAGYSPPATVEPSWNPVKLAVRMFGKTVALFSKSEEKVHANLLRHIMGNPFKPYPAPASSPSSVVQLAESLYAGTDCAFALHDALLDAGHAELAEHFRQEQWHPKGCWAIDVILGKD